MAAIATVGQGQRVVDTPGYRNIARGPASTGPCREGEREGEKGRREGGGGEGFRPRRARGDGGRCSGRWQQPWSKRSTRCRRSSSCTRGSARCRQRSLDGVLAAEGAGVGS